MRGTKKQLSLKISDGLIWKDLDMQPKIRRAGCRFWFESFFYPSRFTNSYKKQHCFSHIPIDKYEKITNKFFEKITIRWFLFKKPLDDFSSPPTFLITFDLWSCTPKTNSFYKSRLCNSNKPCVLRNVRGEDWIIII